jgi:hypothetical protein
VSHSPSLFETNLYLHYSQLNEYFQASAAMSMRTPLYVGFFAGYNFNSAPTFRDNLWGCLTLENGTDRLSRNVGVELPL